MKNIILKSFAEIPGKSDDTVWNIVTRGGGILTCGIRGRVEALKAREAWQKYFGSKVTVECENVG